MDRTIYKSLLSKISENLHTGVPRGNNDTFNIFTVLGVETKEVILCRLLRELLDPRGSHRLGEKPLLLFVQNVLGYPDFNESEAKKAKVIAEETIADNRRVDLVIRTGEKTIPIEVKVWAGDQDAQLSDYYNYYRSNGLNCIFYLTPTGWTPSARSRGDLQVEKEIRLLAFDKSIKPWLKSLIPYCEHESVRICVEQFTEVIEKMCAANAELEVIQNILGLNEETFDTANPSLEAFVAIMNNGKDIAFQNIQDVHNEHFLCRCGLCHFNHLMFSVSCLTPYYNTRCGIFAPSGGVDISLFISFPSMIYNCVEKTNCIACTHCYFFIFIVTNGGAIRNHYQNLQTFLNRDRIITCILDKFTMINKTLDDLFCLVKICNSFISIIVIQIF